MSIQPCRLCWEGVKLTNAISDKPSQPYMDRKVTKSSKHFLKKNTDHDLGPLHMVPVNRAGSVTEMKLYSVHMATFSPLSEIPVRKTEISATEPARFLIWTRRDFF